MQQNNPDTQALAIELAYSALRGVIDPEVGINIVDLGLVYSVAVNEAKLAVVMSLTTPACPMGKQILDEVREALLAKVGHLFEVDVRLEWEPPWDPQMMSEKAKQLLGWR